MISFNNGLLSHNGGMLGDVTPKIYPAFPLDLANFNDYDETLQYKWNAIVTNSNYIATNSMLYKRVDVHSPIRILSATIAENQVMISGGGAFSPSNSNCWNAAVRLFDSSFNYQLLNTESSSSTNTVGNIEVFTFLTPTTTNNWARITLYCDVTLQQGTYWWPLFIRKHSLARNTQCGYYSNEYSEYMAIRDYTDPTNASYPPIYIDGQTSGFCKAYLKLMDEKGNEYYV